MATLYPFRALRPTSADAATIAAVPYDVVSTDEARALASVDQVAARVTPGEPIIDFGAPDGVHHTIWRVGGADRDALVDAFAKIPALYIADGHHRAASAARARTEMCEKHLRGASLGDGADASSMLAVAFPHDQVQI